MRYLLTQLLYEMEEHHDTVLVSIVSESGSTPRGTGSQMLVGSHGRVNGTIGGGRVEKQSEETALSLLTERRSRLQHFGLNLSGGPDSLGMACGGDVTVLFQFIPWDDGAWRSLTAAAVQALRENRPGWLVLRTDGGEPALLDASGAAIAGQAPAGPLSARAVLADDCFYVPLPVGERAVIFGAGHIARALVPLLRTINFRPVVFDDRPEYADPAAFPEAEAVLCGNFRDIAATIDVTPEDYVIIMTSGHLHDLEAEEQMLRRETAYVGVIGSRSKIAYVNQRLREAGISEEAIASVHTPIGTPIRAVTPEEIAVSIAGELIYERACRWDATAEKPSKE